MSKLIELSIIFATIAIPAHAARFRDPVRGLKKMAINMVIFEAIYLLAMRFLHGRF